MKRLVNLLLLFLSLSGSVMAQSPSQVQVESVVVTRTGLEFKIDYVIAMGEEVRDCEVKLYLSVDAGEHFYSQALETNVSGDIGKIRSGGKKAIYYRMTVGDAEKLADKPLVFKVQVASISRKGKTQLSTPVNGAILMSINIDKVIAFSSSAMIGCTVIAERGYEVIEKGIVWSTKSSPTLELASKADEGAGDGDYYCELNGLKPETNYFVRAYVICKSGIFYSNQVRFTTRSR